MRLYKYMFALLIPVFLFGGCAKKSADTPGTAAAGTVKGVPEIVSVTKRPDLFPNFSWKDKDGKTTDFESFKGKLTLVNFWATWCVPCKKELPDLVSLSTDVAGQNVKVLGISLDPGSSVSEDVASFVRDNGITYPVIISSEDLEELLGVRGIPMTFLIDANGKIVQSFFGEHNKEFFAKAIADAQK